MPKFFSNINLKRNELQFPIVHQSDGTPTNSAAEFSLRGQLYFDIGYTGGTGVPLFICTTSGTSGSPSGTWKVVDWTHSTVKTGIKVTAANGSTPAYIDNDFSATYLAALSTNPVADDLMIIQQNTGDAFKAVKMSELAGYVNGLQTIISLSGDTANGVATMSGTAGQLDVETTLLFDGAAGLSIGGAGNSTDATITRVARTAANVNAGAFTITGQNQYAGGDSIDRTGGAVKIFGGRGTGTGKGGSVILKTAAVAAESGSGLNALSNTWDFNSSGVTTFPGAIESAPAQNLILSSPEDIHFKIDSDTNSTSQFEWYAGATEIATLNESGDLQIDGTLQVSGGTFTFDSVGITGIETASESSTWANDDVTLVTTAGIKTYIDAQNFSTADGNTSNGLTALSITPSTGSVATILHQAGGAGFVADASNNCIDADGGAIGGLTVKFEAVNGAGAVTLNSGIIVLAGSNFKAGQQFSIVSPSGSANNILATVQTIVPVTTAGLGSPGTGILQMIGGTGIVVDGVISDDPDSLTVKLATTAVTPATYGSQSNVPQITVDAHGRITAASDVAITSANNSTITFAGGTALELDTSGSNGDGAFTLNQSTGETVTLKHSDVTYVAVDDGTGDATLAFGGTFDVLNSITIDSQGHATGSNESTLTMPTPTTVGGALFDLTNPGAIRFIRIDANNGVTALSDTDFRTAIGAGTSSTSGTVTGTGTQNNLAKFASGGAAIEDSSITDNGSTVAVSGILTVSGNAAISGNLSVADLTVNGTTTTVNSTVVNVTDPIFTLANYNTADSKDRGIEFFHGADAQSNFTHTVEVANAGGQLVKIFIDDHGYEVGNLITVSGSSFQAGLAGDYVISEIVDVDSFKFAGPGGLSAETVISSANVNSVVSGKGFFGLDSSATKFTALRNAVNTGEVFEGTPMDANFGAVFSNGTQLANYTHHTQSAIASDTGALTGATVVSDLEIQVNAEGHTTTAAITTRDLTLNDLGYTGSADANTYVLPTNLDGDDIDIDTTGLTGATVISDLDINITTNTSGLVTDASGTVATRELTLADLGLTLRTHACEIDVDEASGVFASNGNALITHSWATQNVIVQCYVGGELIHADVTLADATVLVHFDKIPATNPTVVIMEAAGTAHTTTVPTYPV